MENKNIIKAANILFNHKLNCTGLPRLPENCIPTKNSEAYEIQEELKIKYLILKDNYCIGKKVGCTNKIAQKQIEVYEPFYGNIYSKYAELSGCKLKLTKFYKPFIEPEISFRIKEDININNAPFSIADSQILFDKILPSIEIVDFRFGENIRDIGINNLIATNGASDFWVHSKEQDLINTTDLEDHIVKLYLNNQLIEEGNTSNVLNNPINSALWIINKLAEKGEAMLKGQYISTGTCTKAFQIMSKGSIKADFGSIGIVELNFI